MPSNSENFAPTPSVTFIIPVLNAAGILENCLQSIRRQDYPLEKIEIILADGGSTDGTPEIGKKYGAVVIDDRVSRHMEDSKRWRWPGRAVNSSFSLMLTTN